MACFTASNGNKPASGYYIESVSDGAFGFTALPWSLLVALADVLADPDMKKPIGSDGTIGFVYAWKEIKRLGKESRIMELSEGEKILRKSTLLNLSKG